MYQLLGIWVTNCQEMGDLSNYLKSFQWLWVKYNRNSGHLDHLNLVKNIFKTNGLAISLS